MVRLTEKRTTIEENHGYNGKINQETHHYKRES